jgi:NADH:ubiquinone reductase (H+-translocating)
MQTHEVIVLGAGYAGLAAVTQLAGRLRRHAGVRVTLVGAEDTFTERMRLHMTATGQPTARYHIKELLQDSGVVFVRGRVAELDADGRVVRLDDGRGLPYDTLVYALGTVASGPGFTLDAPAALAGALRRARGRVVVVGAGLTGIETAAEIAERFPALEVVLAARAEPGAWMRPRAREHVRKALDRLGVRIGTDADVRDGDVVVWAGGTRGAAIAEQAGLTVDERGRIVTDGCLRSVSHPEIYAVGDAAAVPQRYGTMHGTCQGGMPTGVHAAVQIERALRDKPPRQFRFGYYHTPVSLGRHDAVVQFTRPDNSPRRIVLTGRLATWYKETVTASPWSTFGRMLRSPASGAWWPRGGRYTR